jgi:hypothetical protein
MVCASIPHCREPLLVKVRVVVEEPVEVLQATWRSWVGGVHGSNKRPGAASNTWQGSRHRSDIAIQHVLAGRGLVDAGCMYVTGGRDQGRKT